MKPIKLHLRSRRLIAMTVTVIAFACCWFAVDLETKRLGTPAIMSGSVILACLVLLMALGLRRRLPFWPLGSVSMWTQIHIYMGIFTSAVYVIHVPAIVGGGVFESVLSCLFLTVSISGFYGIYASRTLPKRLTAVEGQQRFDRVRWHREQIAQAADQVLAGLTQTPGGHVLDSFYAQTLEPFFSWQPSLVYIMVPRGTRRRKLLGSLKELHRYLESDGRKAAGKFAALVRRRDDLDYQFALQLRLRLWLVVHGICSLALILASLIHVALVFRFID